MIVIGPPTQYCEFLIRRTPPVPRCRQRLWVSDPGMPQSGKDCVTVEEEGEGVRSRLLEPAGSRPDHRVSLSQAVAIGENEWRCRCLWRRVLMVGLKSERKGGGS